MNLAEARALSIGCPYCGGFGLKRVYHPTYRGEPVGEDKAGRIVPLAVESHCVCPYGRFMRACLEPDDRHRIPDFQHVLAGHSIWLDLDPIGEEDD
jgi:hypothetical protein